MVIDNLESLEDTRIRLADERKKRKYPFKDMDKTVPKNPFPIKVGSHGCETNCKRSDVDDLLKYLKSQEPNSDDLFFRLAIIEYEWGDLNRAIVYAERFTNNETMYKVSDNKKIMFKGGFKDRSVILSEGKLAMADMLTQLYLLSLSLGWDWNEIRKLGVQHLEERHEDLKRDGWVDPKKKVEK